MDPVTPWLEFGLAGAVMAVAVPAIVTLFMMLNKSQAARLQELKEYNDKFHAVAGQFQKVLDMLSKMGRDS